MKADRKMLILALSVAGLFGFGSPCPGQQTPPKQKPAAQVAQPEQEPEYTEEEYDAYEKATQEQDLDKRGAMLLAFMEKFPKSKLMTYIVTEVQRLMYDHKQNQRWAKLLPLSEQWLKYYPNDLRTFVYIAESAHRLGQDQKYIDYALKIYALKPNCDLAASIASSYEKIGSKDKTFEWTQKLFSCPEYDGNYSIRYAFVLKYLEAKEGDKAAEYAGLTLKALELNKKPANQSEAEWSAEKTKVAFACNHVIAINYYNKKKYPEAIKAFERAAKFKKDSDAYYYIARSQWELDQVDDAILSFAVATKLGGEREAEAKNNLEKLYKAIHNNTLIGIEKVYTKAERVIAGRPPE